MIGDERSDAEKEIISRARMQADLDLAFVDAAEEYLMHLDPRIRRAVLLRVLEREIDPWRIRPEERGGDGGRTRPP